MITFQQRLADPALRAAAIAELVAKPSREAPLKVQRAAEGGDLTFRISTSGLDRYNSTIDPKGWNLDQYRLNPVVLWMHDMWTPPVARTKTIEADDEGLVAVPQWADRVSHPLAGTVEDMVRGGFLSAASVSWDADKYAYNEKRGGIDFLEQTLLEWSIVTVPGNADALVQRARAAGVDVDPLRAFAERVMRATGSKDAEAMARGGEASRLYVFARGIERVEAPTPEGLRAAVDALALRRSDDEIEVEQPMQTACECGREFAAEDKFCAACGKQRAVVEIEVEPDEAEGEQTPPDEEIDAERVMRALAALS